MATKPVGIDFSAESCFIGVARAGSIEVIINEYSQCDTVSFHISPSILIKTLKIFFFVRNFVAARTCNNGMMGTFPKNQIITNVNWSTV